ncbi:zf-HC2 domain-containing protein [Cellulosimicrobium protaetiae]|uniref:Zf-HC2 domain-containing protein n=1 Tax=Cellulosimicrobium protaetiae TaxID=2587808 RepID=A0A6M5UIE5_9MICO|nr:zf-HC2 domain-containing protein [Cellulosimicrobium protaetiae]QJW37312.1 zf-HC2 domain-containing protein [Cellulosimicrobium protaetiae]
MTHLGSRLSALVDGQLTPAEAERALEHVACCPRCAAELTAARAARRALSSAGPVEPAPDLAARLLALSAQIPTTAGDPLRSAPATPWAEPATLPRGAWSGEVRRGTLGRRIAGLVVGGVGIAAVGLFVLGESPVVTPDLHRSDPLSVLAQAAPRATGALVVGAAPALGSGDGSDGSGVSGAGTLAALDAAGWACPTAWPEGFTVVGVRHDGARGVLEIDLEAPGGEAVVREQAGLLDAAALAGGETWDVDGRRVHVLSEAPWHVVWQSGDTVVDVVADTEQETVAALVAAFPARDYDAGVPARISRGWTTMTGALGTS